MNAVKLKPIIFGGVLMEDYFIEYINSEVRIWSKKRIMQRISIPKTGKAAYPKMKFRLNGKSISADIHRVIGENLIPFPKPENIKQKVWKNTDNSIKDHIKSLYFLNHIDHNKYNCHPSNLEWVTSKGNARAFQKYIKS
jgi:hypothetical protein